MKVFGYDPVQYRLQLESELVMNELVGDTISLEYLNQINCVVCGKLTKKSFAQGFCYNCFMKSPRNSPCIIRPELCEAHEGKGRDPEWEKEFHFQEHIVYLALTDKVKVGVTRKDQMPTRWIDQGAFRAIVLAEVPYRQLAGLIEVELKESFSDKTSWQRMLKNEIDDSIDLLDVKDQCAELLPEEYHQYISVIDDVFEFKYPVESYPTKVKSLSFDKTPSIEKKLVGIRGHF